MKLSKIFILAALFFLCSSLGSSQLARQWVARFSTTVKNGNSAATAMAVDDSGFVYVTGWTTRQLTGIDIATIKYSPDGEKLWAAYYDGGFGGRADKGCAIAVDSSDNVYVTGTSDGGAATGLDFITLKYNRTGDTLKWARRYDGPAHGADTPIGVAVNDSFYVYVSGSSAGSGTGLDYATIKYKANGDSVWARRHNGPLNGDDFPTAMVLNGFTDLYVTGAETDTMYDYFTIKYNAITGDSVWAAYYNGPGDGNDIPSAMAVRSTGLYITGASQDSVTGYDYCTVRYNTSTGAQVWLSRYDGSASGDDFPSALAVSTSGSRVYVTGKSLVQGEYFDAVTVAYAQSSGNVSWSSPPAFNGTANDDDAGVAVSTDSDPLVLAYASDEGVGKDYVLIKYKGSNGSLEWSVTYNGPGNDDDVPAALRSFTGSYYVTGSSIGTTFLSDFLTIKYSDPSHLKYRTFTQESLVVKDANLKNLSSKVTPGSIRDTAFARAFPKIKRGYPGYPGGMVVGNPRPDSAKTFGWIRLDKGSAVAALLPDTGRPRGLDTTGGKPFVGEKKDIAHKAYNNHLVGQLVALRVNIGASDAEVTPPTLGDLTYTGADTINGVVLNGMSLRQIASLTDNLLTYWRHYQPVNWKLLDSILTKVNAAFQGPLKVVSTSPLVVTGAVPVDSVAFLAPGMAPVPEPLAFPKGSLEETPKQYVLYQNYPNPFNPTTTIEFDLPASATVSMKVYDILGREVTTLLQDQEMEEGHQEVVLNASSFASGVYFYRLLVNHGEFQQVKKMVVLK